jgi:two-component system, LytTR family, response regulator AlgR
VSAAAPLRVLIVDDEAPARSRLRDLLADCAAQMPVAVAGEAANGREALDLLGDAPADVVLLDIRMPGMDGIELAQHLQGLAEPPAVIFTTAYDVYAIKAFELHAVDYLLKPVRLARLAEALARAGRPKAETLRQLAQGPRTHLSCQERGRIHLIPVAEVIYLKAELKYVTVRTRERDYLVEESLTRLEEEFGTRFVRIHRNCLVARRQVAGLERVAEESGDVHWVVLLRDSAEKLPVSRRQQHVIKEFGR